MGPHAPRCCTRVLRRRPAAPQPCAGRDRPGGPQRRRHHVARLRPPAPALAILAARGGDGDTAVSHLAEARSIAEHLGGDHDGGWHQLSFGPSNVGIHEVAAAVELGDGTRALDRARNVRLPAGLPRIRARTSLRRPISRPVVGVAITKERSRALYAARRSRPRSRPVHHPTTREVLRMLWCASTGAATRPWPASSDGSEAKSDSSPVMLPADPGEFLGSRVAGDGPVTRLTWYQP